MLSAAHKDCVKMEAASSVTKNSTVAINPEVPVRGMEQAFCCLYFLTKQRIAHTTNYEPLLDLVGFLDTDIKAKILVNPEMLHTQVIKLSKRWFL